VLTRLEVEGGIGYGTRGILEIQQGHWGKQSPWLIRKELTEISFYIKNRKFGWDGLEI
jgi:hypothetical protein